MRLAAGAGLAGVLLVAGVAWAVMGDDEEKDPGTGAVGPAPSSPASPAANQVPDGMQEVTFKNQHGSVKVLVPKGWKPAKSGTYVDYRDPDNADRWLRINIYKPARKPTSEFESAEKYFKDAAKKRCQQDTYVRVELSDQKLGTIETAGQLEYQCTPPDKEQRHALWRIGVDGGVAYHVYLSTLESTFAADRPVFDKAIESFAIATT
jgi:hypothetical protein